MVFRVLYNVFLPAISFPLSFTLFLSEHVCVFVYVCLVQAYFDYALHKPMEN